MDFGLLRCAFGHHTFGNPIKDETLNKVTRICIYCSFIESLILKDKTKEYEMDKQELISDINSDKLLHARRKLNKMLTNLGYEPFEMNRIK